MKMGNTILTILGIIAGAVVVCVLGALGVGKFLPLSKNIRMKILKSQAKAVNVIKFSDLAAFFKSPERWTILKNNKHILPIAIKEKDADGTIFVQACLFDEEKDDVFDIEKNAIVYSSKSMDFELENYFGDKDMIILR